MFVTRGAKGTKCTQVLLTTTVSQLKLLRYDGRHAYCVSMVDTPLLRTPLGDSIVLLIHGCGCFTANAYHASISDTSLFGLAVQSRGSCYTAVAETPSCGNAATDIVLVSPNTGPAVRPTLLTMHAAVGMHLKCSEVPHLRSFTLLLIRRHSTTLILTLN